MSIISQEERRQNVLDYMSQKDKIEEEILVLSEILQGPGLPGLKGNLIDEEGFPRADLDLF
jgi:26S proteasome non-ATPase regulatory subunit 9